MKFVFYYYFTEREYEANSIEELANKLNLSVDEVTDVFNFAKQNNGFCIIGNDPNMTITKKTLLFYARTREELKELFNERYSEMLNGTTN